MKAVISNASEWIIIPPMDALDKYLSISMYSPKEILYNISSNIVVSTLMSLIKARMNFIFVIKYFN